MTLGQGEPATAFSADIAVIFQPRIVIILMSSALSSAGQFGIGSRAVLRFPWRPRSQRTIWYSSFKRQIMSLNPVPQLGLTATVTAIAASNG